MAKSDQQTQLEQLWRTAMQREGGLKIPCGDKPSAIRMRYMLYNAVKWARDPKPGQLVDSRLAEAIVNCSVSLADGGTFVHIKRKVDDPLMQAVAKFLEGEPVKDTESLALQEGSARLMERLAREGLVAKEVAPDVQSPQPSAGVPPDAVPGVDFPMQPRKPVEYLKRKPVNYLEILAERAKRKEEEAENAKRQNQAPE